VVIILLIVIFIAIVAATVGLVTNELLNYAQATAQQFEQQEEKVSSLEALIDEQQERLDEQQIQLGDQENSQEAQEEALDALRQSSVEKEQLAEVEGDLDEHIVNLEELRMALTMQISGLVTETQTLTETVSLLDEGQATLSQDLSSYSRTLDDLGVELEGVMSDVTTLKEQDTTLQEDLTALEGAFETADVDGLRQALFLFRLWEMITRARIRLAEQNPGLAADDIDLAQTAVSDFIENGPEEFVEPLIRVERRLLLAAENLPDEPDLAIGDLDLAWRELDEIFVDILGMPGVPTN
jgi:chromosome segregation ATPase